MPAATAGSTSSACARSSSPPSARSCCCSCCRPSAAAAAGGGAASSARQQLAHAILRSPDDRLLLGHDDWSLHQLLVLQQHRYHLILSGDIRLGEAQLLPQAVAT